MAQTGRGAAPAAKARGAARPGARQQVSELAVAIKACRSAFVVVALFSGVLNVLMLAGSLYMLEVYDRVLPSRSVPTLIGLSLLVAILYAGQGVLDFIRGRILVRIGGALDEALGARVYSSILKLPLKVGRGGDSMQPVRDLDGVRAFLSGTGPTALFDLPWLPLYLAIIFMFHVLLGLTALVGAIVLVLLTVLAERLTRKPITSGTQTGIVRNGLTTAGNRNAEVIAALGMGGRMATRWEEANRDYLAEQRSVSDIAGGFGAVSKVLRMLLQSAMLGVGAWLVIEQQATAGIIITASILSGRALAPVDLVIANWKGLLTARQGWQRLAKILAAVPADAEPMAMPMPNRHIFMQGVSVAAPGTQRPLVLDASFALEAGHAVGIIGPSGSGKSTLVRALVGAWQPAAGRVRLDGADLDQWSPQDRGRFIGYLPQDVELFAGSIAENIARFEPDADPALIIAAAKAAGAHDLIVGFRDGYETQVGELGEAVSAGQRQRIALARALYRDPFLVVLDEPNSNLDAEGEQALFQAILSVRQRGGIVVLVAHRPSALGTVDFILAMNQGRVQAFGLKDEVLAKLFPRPQPAVAAVPRLRLATEEPAPSPGLAAAGE
ncbi:type I secretion system permease/ATPase [Mesorhizobium sp. M00.F.Ca.ET.186.01.1.1]|nr:type I secretion system permease/ATPase [bacterium M00.F.Ca.ET.205.01.1.1]TGU50655.1 type I secretion system permease/ATPase [bacterium M00.F.Ca.ET.152.01.1.1]TGV34118.1 type I secretion system permease/ATPase [Mesorhizobium sp. M00.F.Ca.ET.186.01.1.1]TGZ41019.1 type I secretion system permease/ATPase [bacterium M00.F.Ca.ET.162.01.1.1]